MGYKCSSCGCNNCNCSCNSSACDSTGCPTKLDFSCIIYHKFGNKVTELDGLDLGNFSTLELVIETIDEYIKQLDVTIWELPILRAEYTINTLQQFGQSVDTELGELQAEIDALSLLVNVPLVANDSTTIDFTTSGTLGHTLTGSVIVSPTVGNQLSILGDGLYSQPQTLAIDYINKTMSISDGNEVSFASLVCGVGGYLGEFSGSDPAAADGQYWFRTDLAVADGLRIRLDGNVRTIPTT